MTDELKPCPYPERVYLLAPHLQQNICGHRQMVGMWITDKPEGGNSYEYTRAPQQVEDKLKPTEDVVKVCPDCDIAHCKHIRAMRPDTVDETEVSSKIYAVISLSSLRSADALTYRVMKAIRPYLRTSISETRENLKLDESLLQQTE